MEEQIVDLADATIGDQIADLVEIGLEETEQVEMVEDLAAEGSIDRTTEILMTLALEVLEVIGAAIGQVIGREKCTRQYALNVEANVMCRSSQQRANLFIARLVLLNANLKDFEVFS